MNKKIRVYDFIWAVFFLAFQVIYFIMPPGHTGSKTAYWLITLAFAGQYLCAFLALKETNLKKLFYGIPMILISYVGLTFTILCGILLMAVPGFPDWAGVSLCVGIFAFTAAAAAGAKAEVDFAGQVDEKARLQTFFIKNLTAEAESLAAKAGSEEIRAACKEVYEAAPSLGDHSQPCRVLRGGGGREHYKSKNAGKRDGGSSPYPEPEMQDVKIKKKGNESLGTKKYSIERNFLQGG